MRTTAYSHLEMLNSYVLRLLQLLNDIGFCHDLNYYDLPHFGQNNFF